jgi:hypothetical protein
MAELVVIRDPLRGGRTFVNLRPGETIAAELRRHFPDGIPGAWELYRGEAHPDCYLPYASHETSRVDGGRYVLVMKPTGPLAGPLLLAFMVSALLSIVQTIFAPDMVNKASPSPDSSSPNNRLAGQTNQLRPGARVPDILGVVRAYPDLFAAPIEQWTRRTQFIQQFFVLGVGDYSVANAKVGETPVANISGAALNQYGTTSNVPTILAVKTSSEIGSMGLTVESDALSQPGAGAVFAASGSTMTTQSYVPVTVGTPIRIDGTASNNGFFDVTAAAAPSQPNPPFVYTLAGRAVVSESAATPSIQNCIPVQNLRPVDTQPYGPSSTPLTIAGGANVYINNTVGVITRFSYVSGGSPVNLIGTCATVGFVSGSHYPGAIDYFSTYKTLANVAINFPAADLPPPPIPFQPQQHTYIYVSEYTDPGAPGTGTGGGPTYNLFTNWYVAPMQNPDEIWIDIAFPSGLAWYQSGTRKPYSIGVTAEIRRVGAAAAQATQSWTFTDSTQGYIRWTERIVVSSLSLPAGSPYIQVRLQQTTEFLADDATNQRIQDTRWERFAATRNLDSAPYPTITVMRLTMQNTQSAVNVAAGNSSFNCEATRVLPTWTGSAWSTPAASTKWADALVARMKAIDGANKTDADIDIAGIYAIQATLNGQDSGAQGAISLTLDTSQDIDAELQLIGGLARCVIYRVGTKLFASRDQGGKTAVALFTGRSKSPEAETLALSLASESDPDAFLIQYIDVGAGYKIRTYQFPTAVTPANPTTLSPPFANWAQAWRRAQYEWNRLQLRRDSVSMSATDEARLLHLGDVINVVDDVSNLAQSAGEVIAISDDFLTLTLDRALPFTSGGASYTVLLRSQDGRTTDSVPLAASSAGNLAVLSRGAAFPVKGRDDGLGSMYAIYSASLATVRPWLVTMLEQDAPYMKVTGANWRNEVFAGDTATLPPAPVYP